MEEQQKEIWVLNPAAKALYSNEENKGYPWKMQEFDSLESLLDSLSTEKPAVILIFDAEQQSLFASYKAVVNTFSHFCPIIGVCNTAHTHEERQQILAYGFNDCISSPLKEKVVESTLNHWLNISFDRINNQNNGHEPNEEVLKELLKFMDTAQLEELMLEFKRSTLKQLNELNQLSNSTKQAEILHELKGSASSLGFLKIANTADSVEKELKKKPNKGDNEYLRKFVTETHYFLINFTS